MNESTYLQQEKLIESLQLQLKEQKEGYQFLLSKNEDDCDEMNKLRKLNESLKQENFCTLNENKMLKNQLDNMDYSILQDENDKIKKDYEDKIKEMVSKHKSVNRDIRDHLEATEQQLDLKKSECLQLNDEVKSLQAELDFKKDESLDKSTGVLDKSHNSNFNTSKFETDKREIIRSYEEKLETMENYFDDAFEKLNEQIETLKAEKDDLIHSNIEYGNKIEKNRQEMELMAVELDHLRVEDVDRQGNSLFAEVDDRRVKAQQKLLHSEAFIKNLKSEKDQMEGYNMSLKAQINTMMRSSDSNEKVNDIVFRMESEINLLTREKKKLILENIGLQGRIENILKKSPKSKQETKEKAIEKSVFVEYLEKQCDVKDEKIRKLKKKLWNESLCLTDEIEKRTRAEAQIAPLQDKISKLSNKEIKLKMEINLLKLKVGDKVDRPVNMTCEIKTETVVDTESDDSFVECKESPKKLQSKENIPPVEGMDQKSPSSLKQLQNKIKCTPVKQSNSNQSNKCKKITKEDFENFQKTECAQQ